MDNEKYFFPCLYRSPNQNHEELENFISNLDLLISNINDNHPICSILTGGFNTKCSNCSSSDKNNWTKTELDNITTSAGHSQLIKEPTHFRGGSRAAATSKMERFVIIVNGCNYYHKALNLG